MIHEGLVLEYSGWHLGLSQLAAQVRQLCFLLLAALVLPGGSAWWAHLPWVLALAGAITIGETLFAKVRLFEVPQLLVTAFVLAAASIGMRAFGGFA
jgi:formate hydrogenlyase subunit 4